MGRWIITLAMLAVCFVLAEWLPFSPYFRNMDTMVHEFGHAAATLLLSGKVQYIHLYENHSGVTLSAVQGGWRLIPVALSGYAAASLFSVLLFALHRHHRERFGLAIVTGIAAVTLALFIDNDYGQRWLLGFIALNVVAFLLPIRFIRVGYFLLLAFLSLAESVSGAVTVAILSYMSPAEAGDAANLARVTGIPAAVWGSVFLIFALYCARHAIGHFFAPTRKGPTFAGRGRGHAARG